MKKYSEGKDYKVIAFCISRFQREEQSNTIQYFCQYCAQYHCKLVIFTTLTDLFYDDINDHGEKQIYSVFDTAYFDAVIIMSETFKKTKVDREIADRAIAAHIPVISVSRRLEGCINIDFTYGDSFERIVRHMVEEHGCRNLFYIGGDRESSFSKERLECYKKVLAENEIPFQEEKMGYGEFRDEVAVQVLHTYLQSGNTPEAVICANDMMAIAVCVYLKKIGMRIPEDIKVTGFDGLEYERYHNPRITTAAYDWDRVTQAVYETVWNLIEGKQTEELILIPYIYQEGRSCGCCRKQVFSAMERLFSYRTNKGKSEEYYQHLMNMNSKSNDIEDFVELLCLLEEYSCAISYREYWLLLNDNFWDKIIKRQLVDKKEYQEWAASREGGAYSENMILASHVSEEGCQQSIQVERQKLLPNLDTVFQKEDYITFLPVHLQGITIGYMAFAFHRKDIKFDFLNLYLMNFRNVIEDFWNKIILEHMFSRDELTSLYNRRAFLRQLQKYYFKEKAQDIFTLISIDMNNLKQINDCYGHGEGDEALKQLAESIRQSVGPDELCARMGGDEFVIVSADQQGRVRAQEIKSMINTHIENYNKSSFKAYRLSASIGFCSGEKVEMSDYYKLVSKADSEMYKDKKKHKHKNEAPISAK